MGTRIGIVDDHRLFLEGLKALLGTVDDLTVVAEADSAQAGRLIIKREDLDVLLVDWRLPDIPGDIFLREAHRTRPSLPLIALTMFGDAQHVEEAFAAGAAGYVCKSLGFSDLVQAIRRVRSGGRYVPSGFAEFAERNASHHPIQSNDGSLRQLLTLREREVFRLVVYGLSTKEIAFHLGMSGRTVETHRGRLLRKLRVHSTADLVRLAARHGLLEP